MPSGRSLKSGTTSWRNLALVRIREHCEQCGFDSDLYNRADTISSQPIIAPVLRAAAEGLDGETLGRRPNPTTWSIAEYADHVREVAFGNRFAIECALNDPGIDLGPAPEASMTDSARVIDFDTAVAAVEVEFDALQDVLASLAEDQWNATVAVDGKPTPVGWFARHVIHDGLHHMADIGRIRHGFGLGAPHQSGSVHQLNRSGGGVPKMPVDSAEISPRGVDGDRQSDRRNHGRPAQAVCLWSADVLASLHDEGHPIAPGNAGENITIEGVEWATLRPGTHITVGSVPMLISAHAIPCSKNAQWFADRDFNRILHDRNPGFSRLYAIPLGTGVVTAGDRVIVEPSAATPLS